MALSLQKINNYKFTTCGIRGEKTFDMLWVSGKTLKNKDFC